MKMNNFKVLWYRKSLLARDIDVVQVSSVYVARQFTIDCKNP